MMMPGMQGQDIVQANTKETSFEESWKWDDTKKVVVVSRRTTFEIAPIGVQEMERRLQTQKQGGQNAINMLEEHSTALRKNKQFIKEKVAEMKKEQEAKEAKAKEAKAKELKEAKEQEAKELKEKEEQANGDTDKEAPKEA